MARKAKLPSGELQAFLDAIQANPGDDTVRLVFADWLQEHDDPRAPWVRIAEVWEWMAPDAGDPVPRILAALLDPAQEGRRNQAHDMLQKLGAATVPRVRAWLRESPDERFESLRGYLESAQPLKLRPVRTLMKQIRTGTWYDVLEGVVDLGFHGPKAAPAIDLLLDLPKHDKWEQFADRYHRHNPLLEALYSTFGAIGPAAMKAVPELAENAWHCEVAFDALEQIKPDPLLVVDNINTDEYDEVEDAMRRIVEMDPTKTGVLIHGATTHTGRVRDAATQILTQMGAAAVEAVPSLVSALLANTEWDRHDARTSLLDALRAIGDTYRLALPTLRAALRDAKTTSLTRIDIGVALAKLGEPAEGWAVLATVLEMSDPAILADALVGVREVASLCPQAIPQLFASLRNPQQAVREAAAEQLWGRLWRASEFVPDCLDWVPALIEATHDRSPNAVRSILSSLARIGELNTPIDSTASAELRTAVIDALLRVIDNRESSGDDFLEKNVRYHALRALDRWGELPAHAAEPLQRYAASLQDAHDTEQVNALLAKIQPKA